MELLPSPGECSYQNGSAIATFLIDLLLFCFRFFNLGTFGIFSINPTKETEFSNLLRAFDHLPLSLSLHYRDETFHIGRGDIRSRGCWHLPKWQLCKMRGEALCISVPLVNVHHRIVHNDFGSCRFEVFSC